MPACEECYRAKKSCDRDEQLAECCSRCTRLEIPCVARISRQGQGPKKRKRALQSVEHAQHSLPEKAASRPKETSGATSEDGNVLQALLNAPSSIPLSPKLHYGIRYLIHSWSSFALARRSFKLLERACHLAAKCEIPMDGIFCLARHDVIQPILYNQKTDAQKTWEEIPLQWEELPTCLRNLCRLDCLENRYIMIREAKNGHSRYLASDKFQQDIVSVWFMEQTWKANDKPVIQLFLQGPADFAKFTKAIHYQMSRYTHPSKAPECVRINGLNVMFPNQSSTQTGAFVQEMDLVYAFEIVTLEHSFYVCEFVPPKPSPEEDPTSTSSYASPSMADVEKAGELSSATSETANETTSQDDASLDDPLRLFDNLSPLDEELDDQDFEAFLALLND